MRSFWKIPMRFFRKYRKQAEMFAFRLPAWYDVRDMEGQRLKRNKALKIAGIAAAILIALLLLNRIVYWTLLPIIFFHGVFDESAYEDNLADPSLEPLAVETANGTLYGWQRVKDSRTVVIYYGGDASDSNAWLRGFDERQRQTAFGDATLVTADYPSFGKSEGSISEAAFFDAAEAVYAHVERTYPDAAKVLIGYSLGCAAALEMAARHETDGLVLVAPMYDGTTMYFPRTSLLHAYFEPTASVRLDNDETAKSAEERTLVIASSADTMTRIDDVSALCEAFPAKPMLLRLDAIGHGDYWGSEETLAAIGRFVRETNTQE